jgi:hypothetical protein
MYKDKYLKYKKKYIERKKNLQKGGTIMFNTFGNQFDELVKYKLDADNNTIIEFVLSRSPSNRLSTMERQDIENFVNFIFHGFIDETTNKTVGLDGIKNLEFKFAGGFGLALKYKNIVIKIISVAEKPRAVVTELDVISKIFFDRHTGNFKTDLVSPINKVYGFITGNKKIYDSIPIKPPIVQGSDIAVLQQSGLYTNMNNIQNLLNFGVIFQALKSIAKDLLINYYTDIKLLNGSTVLLFLDAGDGSLNNFKEIFDIILQDQFTLTVENLFRDIIAGCHYLHNYKMIHNDLKLDNIIYKVFNNNYKFELIDFGGIVNFTGDGFDYVKRFVGTPVYYRNDIDAHNTNVFYDYHCIFVLLMELFASKFLKNENLSIRKIIEFTQSGQIELFLKYLGSNNIISEEQFETLTWLYTMSRYQWIEDSTNPNKDDNNQTLKEAYRNITDRYFISMEML